MENLNELGLPEIKSLCKKYEISDPGEKFPKEKLIELAKQLANEQEKHIKHGDYED